MHQLNNQSSSHPHNEHAHQHENNGHHVLEYPGPGVPHEVKSPLVQQRVEVLEEIHEMGILIDL